MDGNRVSGPEKRHHRKRKKKAPAGLQVQERDGHWHIVGTIRVGGRSVRVRRSTELQARADTAEDADALRAKIENEVRAEVIHGVKPSIAVAIAARDYLRRPRKRPIGSTDLRYIQEITKAFGTRVLREIDESEWTDFVAKRQAGNSPETRERYLNAVCAFLAWCQARPRQWISEVPRFDRDKDARNPNTRSRRRVADLTPDLIFFMLDHAGLHLKAQLAVEWSTGARVSSILHGVRLCDLNLAEGRETISFHDTKNTDSVAAALHPYAADVLREYLEIRGNLRDREGPLFLTHKGKPYRPGRGTQNKTAFNAMKRRAVKALRRNAAAKAWEMKGEGDREAAREIVLAAKHATALIPQVTQHWFRHLLADAMLKGGADIRSVMEQGGWRDPKSVMGYTRDVPDHRRNLVRNLPIGDTSLTRDVSKDREKA